MEPFVERVYMTEQLESSHGPNVFYEFVYGLLSHGPGQPTGDGVLLRVVRGASPAPMATEIHVKDLQSVQERFNDFMERVRRRITPAMAAPPPAGAPAPSAPLGRFAPDAPRRKSGGLAVSVPMGPKKGGAPPPPAAASSATPEEEPLFPASPAQDPARAPVREEPAEFSVDSPFEIVSFVLSTPPSAEGILKVADDAPEKIIIVVRADMVKRVEHHLKNNREGTPKDFEILTVRRDSRSGPVGSSKRRSALTLDIQRLLGMPKAVLWIPPEPRKKA